MRHMHALNKEELRENLKDIEAKGFWKIIGGLGTALLAIIALGRLR